MVDKKSIRDFYGNLEISYTESLPEVTSAWKKLIKMYHPDQFCADPVKWHTANRIVAQLNRAYAEIKKFLLNKKNIEV